MKKITRKQIAIFIVIVITVMAIPLVRSHIEYINGAGGIKAVNAAVNDIMKSSDSDYVQEKLPAICALLIRETELAHSSFPAISMLMLLVYLCCYFILFPDGLRKNDEPSQPEGKE